MSFHLDMREWNATLPRYLAVSTNTLADIVNTKGFYIARGATRETYRANSDKFEAELGVTGYNVKQVTRGKNKGKFRKGVKIIAKYSLAEGILRSRDYDKGRKQMTKVEMLGRPHRLINARKRATGFIAAGWIPAIKALQPYQKGGGGQKQDSSVKKWGPTDIGGGMPARPGWSPIVEIWNAAIPPKHPTSRSGLSLLIHATEGLQVALNNEVASMKAYIERKMQQDVDRFTRRLFR